MADEDDEPSEAEAWYDLHVDPVLLRLSCECEARGIPFLALVGYGAPDGFGSVARTVGYPANRPSFFDVMLAAAKCVEVEKGGFNLDRFMLKMMAWAGKSGHASLILNQLGVPANPEDKCAGQEVIVWNPDLSAAPARQQLLAFSEGHVYRAEFDEFGWVFERAYGPIDPQRISAWAFPVRGPVGSGEVAK